MKLKERSSRAGKASGNLLKEGSGKFMDWVTEWVKQGGDTKGSGVRVLWIVCGFGIWFMWLAQEILTALVVTPVALAGVFVWFALRKEKEPTTPAQEPVKAERGAPEAGEGGAAKDEFWDRNTPQAARPAVRLDKADEVTVRDESSSDDPTVRIRTSPEEAPVEPEKPQVSAVQEIRTPPRTPDSDTSVTGNIPHDDHVRIFPVTGPDTTPRPDVEKSQVSEVSGRPDRVPAAPAEEVTERAAPVMAPAVDETMSMDRIGLVVKLSEGGSSVREIESLTGVKKSTVQDILTREKERRRAEELERAASAVVPVPKKSQPPVSRFSVPVLPGAWYGEDGHAQEVRFSDVLEGSAPGFDGVGGTSEALAFIRNAFLGKQEISPESWSVSVEDGMISGELPDQKVSFAGFWSETGTVVVTRVVFH